MNFSSLSAPRIKEERLRLGFNQAQVAEKSGVSREMWGKYERGDAIPGGEVLFSFAAIGADIQYVLTGTRTSSKLLSARAAALINNFELMEDEDKRAIERLVETVRKAPK